MKLKLYNQFPNRYPGGIVEMTEDVNRIAKMGFNAIWTNPMCLVGNKPMSLDGETVHGSMYAATDLDVFSPHFFPQGLSPDKREVLFQAYLKRVMDCGMQPIFDLVMLQIGLNADGPQGPLYKQYQQYSDMLTGDKLSLEKETDSIKVAYDNKHVSDAMMKNIWFPFIKKNIEEYGYQGLRVDAICDLSPDLQSKAVSYAREVCQMVHGCEPVIMAELLHHDPCSLVDKMSGIGFSHVLLPGVLYHDFIKNPVPTEWLYNQLTQLEELSGVEGGTVSFTGNHDLGTLKTQCLFQSGLIESPTDMHVEQYIKQMDHEDPLYQHYNEFNSAIDERIRIHLFYSALICSGGWYVMAGDEYGVVHKPHVFATYHEQVGSKDKWSGQHDFSLPISNLNKLLDKLTDDFVTDKMIVDSIGSNALYRYIIKQSRETSQWFLLLFSNTSNMTNGIINKIMKKHTLDKCEVEKVYILLDSGDSLVEYQ